MSGLLDLDSFVYFIQNMVFMALGFLTFALLTVGGVILLIGLAIPKRFVARRPKTIGWGVVILACSGLGFFLLDKLDKLIS